MLVISARGEASTHQGRVTDTHLKTALPLKMRRLVGWENHPQVSGLMDVRTITGDASARLEVLPSSPPRTHSPGEGQAVWGSAGKRRLMGKQPLT